MKIEVLYGELANLYGDLFNIRFLEQSLDNVTIYYTGINENHILHMKMLI